MMHRLLMFEVYELHNGEYRLLFVSSDPTTAENEMSAGDILVKRYWLREGPDDMTSVTP